LVQFFGQFWAAALPVVLFAAAGATFLFVICFAVYRWHRFAEMFRKAWRYIVRNPQYDYDAIFQLYLQRFNAIKDRRELYQAILELSTRVVRADGASLLVKDARGSFSVRASHGTKPFTGDFSEVQQFITWLERRRELVTRRYLLHSKKCREIKIEGLRYCVQLNAEACIPVFIDGQLYALLNLGARLGGAYDSETRALLKLLTLQFATSIHNANLFQHLERQGAQLKQTKAFKTQLLSNLSHELRTPLNSIIGLSEMLAEGADGPVNSEQMTHLSMIRQSGTRLLDTVTAMLDLSKIEADRLELDVKHISLGHLVETASSNVKLSKSTKLVVDLKERLPSVYGDEQRLVQVLRHLLDNAAKFTKAGRITVEASKAGEMLKVCVRDTGTGIRREARNNVFDGFYQADGSHQRESEGLGLGLSISRKIVELHGGRMWFKSTLGKGSEFFFTLPLKPTSVKYNEIS